MRSHIPISFRSSHSLFGYTRSRGSTIELRSGGVGFIEYALGSIGLRALMEACRYCLPSDS